MEIEKNDEDGLLAFWDEGHALGTSTTARGDTPSDNVMKIWNNGVSNAFKITKPKNHHHHAHSKNSKPLLEDTQSSRSQETSGFKGMRMNNRNNENYRADSDRSSVSLIDDNRTNTMTSFTAD
jgi:hypothetical protein